LAEVEGVGQTTAAQIRWALGEEPGRCKIQVIIAGEILNQGGKLDEYAAWFDYALARLGGIQQMDELLGRELYAVRSIPLGARGVGTRSAQDLPRRTFPAGRRPVRPALDLFHAAK